MFIELVKAQANMTPVMIEWVIFYSKIFVYTLWQHFWDTQYKNIFLNFCFNQNLITNPSWSNF